MTSAEAVIHYFIHMNNNELGKLTAVSILCLVCFMFGWAVSGVRDQKQAISVGVGYHNPISGKFEWRTNLEPVLLLTSTETVIY